MSALPLSTQETSAVSFLRTAADAIVNASELRGEVDSLTARVRELENIVSQLGEAKHTLEHSVSDLTSMLSDSRADASNQRRLAETLSTDLSRANAEIDALNNSLAAAMRERDAEVAEHHETRSGFAEATLQLQEAKGILTNFRRLLGISEPEAPRPPAQIEHKPEEPAQEPAQAPEYAFIDPPPAHTATEEPAPYSDPWRSYGTI